MTAERRLAVLLVTPAVTLMLAVMAYPICYAVWLSLQRNNLATPGDTAFIGLVNYQTVLTDRYWWTALAVTLVYPFAKRHVAMPQAVLGVAFSFGIPMAFAAVRGEVPALAWWLLLGNLFWVLAYDTEYAMVDRDDDLRIGMKTSAITLGRWDVLAVLSFYLVQLVIWSWAIVPQPKAWAWWLGVAVVLAQF